jgi:starvation-inducible DNA-binding protein
MARNPTFTEHALFDAKTTKDLVVMLNQSLADSLDLAYQTKQAHWNVKGPNFYGLHLLFEKLFEQLITYADAFAERAVTMGGQAMGTIRAASAASSLAEYPLEALDSKIHVDALVDRYDEYTRRIRKAVRKAEQLGDQDTADLYGTISRAMDKALWMLKAHQYA